jgi:hypothetical protein
MQVNSRFLTNASLLVFTTTNLLFFVRLILSGTHVPCQGTRCCFTSVARYGRGILILVFFALPACLVLGCVGQTGQARHASP